MNLDVLILRERRGIWNWGWLEREEWGKKDVGLEMN